jgi:hypothetical protein
LLFRLLEGVIGLLTPSPAQYARRMTPLLVSPGIEPHSGALFDQKARAILPSEGLTEAYMRQFTAASEALLARKSIVQPFRADFLQDGGGNFLDGLGGGGQPPYA